MAKKNPVVVGVDVGTYQTTVIVAEIGQTSVEIIGIGTAMANGSLLKGVVANIDESVKVIRKAVDEADLMAGCEIRNVYVSAGGAHIKGVNSHGVVAVKDREVCFVASQSETISNAMGVEFGAVELSVFSISHVPK